MALSSFKTNASVEVCSASISPNYSVKNSTSDFTLTVNNTDSVAYNRIKITVPSSEFWTINSINISGWTVSEITDNVTLSNSSLSPGESLNIGITATTIDSISDSMSWIVDASDDDGGSYNSCTGSLGTSITSESESEPPLLSKLTLSDITSSSLKVSWSTQQLSSSFIEYGLTTSYGQSKTNSSLTTSHSFTLTNLSANTEYHFNVSSTNNLGLQGQWGDDTFTTAKVGLTSEPVTIERTLTPTPTPTPAPDTSKPIVSISTKFSKPFEQPPEIFVKATDNKEVASAEYSMDDGKNWLPISLSSAKKSSLSFNFTPDLTDDGNYKLIVRVSDASGNKGYSKKYDLIIDRLFPDVSGILFSFGPYALNSLEDGTILVSPSHSFKINLSDVGGATSIDIIAKEKNDSSNHKEFKLIKNTDSGLWSSSLNLEKPGEYILSFIAIDGAGNKTERNINRVYVVKNGTVNGANAKITVYYLDKNTSNWNVWDGTSYEQKNPVRVDKNGEYSLFLPAGKYFLKIEDYGFQTQTSEFFILDKPTPINADFNLKQLNLLIDLKIFKIFLPDFSSLTVPFNNSLPEQISNESSLIGKEIPFFSLNDGFKSDSLKGKPSILTFINSWSPLSTEQLSILNNFSNKKMFNNATIVVGEKSSKIYVLKKRGGYSLPMYTDPDATLVNSLNLSLLPTSYILDRKGIVKKVFLRVLSEEEIIKYLSE
jgi:hypothetical protein